MTVVLFVCSMQLRLRADECGCLVAGIKNPVFWKMFIGERSSLKLKRIVSAAF